MLVTTAFAVVVADALALALKVATDRPRPFVANPDPPPLVRPPLDLSFPSGHAATSFAAATVLTWWNRDIAVPVFAFAAAIAASRVYVGVHYPVDVIGGALLGVAVGRAIVLALRALLELFGRAEKTGADYGQRCEQADPDADPAPVGREEPFRDLDQPDEDEDRRQRAEDDDDETLRHRRR